MEKKLNIKSTVTPTEKVDFNKWCSMFNVSGMTPIQVAPTFQHNDINLAKMKKRLKQREFTS